MYDNVEIDPILRRVVDVLVDLGLSADESARLTESVLVRQGHYCGRAFKCESLRAVWFAESNELKVYRDNGPLLRSVRLDDRPTRLAA